MTTEELKKTKMYLKLFSITVVYVVGVATIAIDHRIDLKKIKKIF